MSYSGSLQPKKKGELQLIAQALIISDAGTKDELQARIKRHLDANQDALEDDPRFAGLFGRRRRSVQPVSAIAAREDTADTKPRSSRRSALELVREATPDPTPPSTPAKPPVVASSPPPVDLAALARALTPDPTPPPVVGAPQSPVKKIIQALALTDAVAAGEEATHAVVSRLRHSHHAHMQGGAELLVALRGFLSNSRNIWSLTAVLELLYILAVTIPWQFASIPLGNAPSSPALTLPFPPLSALRAPALWAVLAHWALPTLLLPALFGALVSFDPALRPIVGAVASAPLSADGTVVLVSEPSSTTTSAPTAPATAPIAPLDPLTAAIARLFLATAYPYAALTARIGLTGAGLDVLGSEWRVRAAALGVACAFAEAVGRAPGVAIGLAGGAGAGAGENGKDYKRVEGGTGERRMVEGESAEVD